MESHWFRAGQHTIEVALRPDNAKLHPRFVFLKGLVELLALLRVLGRQTALPVLIEKRGGTDKTLVPAAVSSLACYT